MHNQSNFHIKENIVDDKMIKLSISYCLLSVLILGAFIGFKLVSGKIDIFDFILIPICILMLLVIAILRKEINQEYKQCSVCNVMSNKKYCPECGTKLSVTDYDKIILKKEPNMSDEDLYGDFEDDEKEYSDNNEDIEKVKNAMRNVILEEKCLDDKNFF